ncbi:MAG: type II toxin-antitoxin system RelE/ParE family toxin [Polaromonas sp.]|uniref:type II toxin-antitoxin system RelE/ParE family toxin n=1 Tax=Polaromonas sp. TaxID=1869339 RepID=UPI00184EBB62|nr:type II toxin-antitoxin system RelE/ParE family toxin [Polaromonas sp.]
MSDFFHESARVEHLEHVAYYEARQARLGARYLAAFEAAMVKICEAPDRYRVEFSPGIRRYRVHGFPYNILYRQAGAEVEVLVVAPHRRRPAYWLGRV